MFELMIALKAFELGFLTGIFVKPREIEPPEHLNLIATPLRKEKN